jgi:hypothetical protein
MKSCNNTFKLKLAECGEEDWKKATGSSMRNNYGRCCHWKLFS